MITTLTSVFNKLKRHEVEGRDILSLLDSCIYHYLSLFDSCIVHELLTTDNLRTKSEDLCSQVSTDVLLSNVIGSGTNPLTFGPRMGLTLPHSSGLNPQHLHNFLPYPFNETRPTIRHSGFRTGLIQSFLYKPSSTSENGYTLRLCPSMDGGKTYRE